ncbi:MAG: lysoplasmalogenase [Bacteroidales bacterium]|nr:lysoplasmalogenase [Bacteroidales bacterium]
MNKAKKIPVKILSIAIFISAVLATFFSYQENLIWYSLFKPLTTVLIITLAVFIYLNKKSKYKLLIIIALIIALIGDVLLIGNNHFLYGLGAFFIAHIIFTLAFSSLKHFFSHIPILIILLAIGGIYYTFLQPKLQDFQIPVIVYMLAIITMSWQALSLAAIYKTKVFYGLGIASLLFSFSDAAIAYTKFIQVIDYSSILILPTYWMAIYVFSISANYVEYSVQKKIGANHTSNRQLSTLNP